MIPDRLAAGPHCFDDLDVEQEHANRNDEVADSDWHAAVKDRRHGNLGDKGYLEDHAFLLIGERHIEEKTTMLKNANGMSSRGKAIRYMPIGFLHATFQSYP